MAFLICELDLFFVNSSAKDSISATVSYKVGKSMTRQNITDSAYFCQLIAEEGNWFEISNTLCFQPIFDFSHFSIRI